MVSSKSILNNPPFKNTMFCQTCGSLLIPESNPYGKWLKCPQGHPQPEIQTSSETIILKNANGSKRIEVLDSKNVLAVHDNICKSCGYDKAELIEISCNYSDEDNIFRMKCGKCGFVEQLDGKVK